jgi:hypothetical protein
MRVGIPRIVSICISNGWPGAHSMASIAASEAAGQPSGKGVEGVCIEVCSAAISLQS